MTGRLSIALRRGSRWVVGLLFQIVLLCWASRALAVAAVSNAAVSNAAVSNAAVLDVAETLPEAQSCELAAEGPLVAPVSCGGATPVLSRAPLASVGGPLVAGSLVADPAVPAEGLDVGRGAPMCDPSAASIVARVEIPEVDRGRFEPLPCPDALLLALLADPAGRWAGDGEATLGGGRPAPDPYAPSALGHLDGARSSSLFFPVRAEPRVLGASAVAGIGFSAGHPRAVERPPARQR